LSTNKQHSLSRIAVPPTRHSGGLKQGLKGGARRGALGAGAGPAAASAPWPCGCATMQWVKSQWRSYQANKKLKEKSSSKVIAGQTWTHIAMNWALQVVLIAAFVIGVSHETFPKIPDVKDYPGLGEPGGPISVEAEVVMPFKRYPPGFDVFG